MKTSVGRVLPLAALLVLGLIMAGPAEAFWTAYQGVKGHDGQPQLWGNLTWTGGKGRILWGPTPTGTDNLPASPIGTSPGDAERYEAERYLSSDEWCVPPWPLGGCGPASVTPATYASGVEIANNAYPDTVFESDPLPRTLYVNFTRGFALDLFLLKGSPSDSVCNFKTQSRGTESAKLAEATWVEPNLDVEVLLNDKVIAGGYSQDNLYPFWQRETPNENYGWCFYGMYSEQVILTEGAVLKLRLTHARQAMWYPFGLQGDHRSQLRIALFPPEELVYRFPEYAAGLGLEAPPAPGETPSEGSSAAMSSGSAALLPLPALLAGLGAMPALRSRRRPPVVLAGVLLLVLLFSGCVGNKNGGSGAAVDDPAKAGKIDTLIIPDVGGELSANGTGSIVGEVRDDMHNGIRDVHISLLGLGNFTKSDAKGRFQFVGLLPAIYKLRFDREGFHPYQGEVEVRAGSISKPDVTLQPLDQKAGDFRAHIHDYWDGKTFKEFAAINTPIKCVDEMRPYYGSCKGSGETWQSTTVNRFRVLPTATSSNLIPPGTAQIEVKLTWDTAKLGVEKVGLAASGGWTSVVLAPRVSGSTWIIPTTWEATDRGHQRYSYYEFQWFIPAGEAPGPEVQRLQKTPGYDFGTVTANVKIIRGGSIPLEPGHLDLWKDKTSIPLLERAKVDWWYSGDGPPEPLSPCLTGLGYDCERFNNPWMWFKSAVPPSSKYIIFEIRQNREAFPEPFGVKLYYKHAGLPEADPETLQGYTEASPQDGGTWRSTKFRVNLDDTMTDDEYQSWSNWALTFRPTDNNARWLDKQAQNSVMSGLEQSPFSFKVYGTVFR